MTSETLAEACRLENADPREAAAVYARVERGNRDISVPLFLLALGCVLGAGLGAFLVSRTADSHQTLWALAILVLAGFAPPVLVAMLRARRRNPRRADDPDEWMDSVHVLFWALFHMLEPALIVAILVLLAIPFALLATIVAFFVLLALYFFADVVLSGEEAFAIYGEVVGISAALFTLVGLIAYLVDAAPGSLLSPVQGLREILVGLRLSWRRVLQFLAAVYIGLLIVGSGELELLYAEWWQAVATAGLAGVMLGSNLAPLPRDEAVMRLVELGRIRCDVRRGRRYTARWRILQLVGQTRRHGSPGAWIESSPSRAGELAAEVAECLGALVPQAPWGDPMADPEWAREGMSFLGRRPVRRQWEAWRRERIPRLLRKLNRGVSGFGELNGAWEASIAETTRLVEANRPELARSAATAPEEYWSEEVIDHFRDRSGDLLVREVESETADFELLALAPYIDSGSAMTPEARPLVARYGVFHICVIKNEHALEKELTWGAEDAPDERGIYWHFTYSRFGSYWEAETRYRNVVLWWQAGEERKTDRRWDRLNSILADLGKPP